MPEALASFFASKGAEWLLFASAIVSATLMPGGSEVILLGAAVSAPERRLEYWAVATAGNALGAMTSYVVGRWIPERGADNRAVRSLKRWGAPALLLSWVPLVGDALPLAAGWLRLSPWTTFLFVLIGKGARYAAILGALQPWLG